MDGVLNRVRELEVPTKILANHGPHWAVVGDMILEKLIWNAIHVAAIDALENHASSPLVVVINTQ